MSSHTISFPNRYSSYSWQCERCGTKADVYFQRNYIVNYTQLYGRLTILLLLSVLPPLVRHSRCGCTVGKSCGVTVGHGDSYGGDDDGGGLIFYGNSHSRIFSMSRQSSAGKRRNNFTKTKIKTRWKK